MRFLSLQLSHFRSYAEASVAFPREGGVTFLGENGAGKTNLLEALSILSLTRSCRGSDESDIVRWNESFYRLKATVESDGGEKSDIEVVSERVPRRRKALFQNGVRTTASAFVGFVPTVTFLPQDLLLFSGPPAERRRFLDQLLSQVSPDYLAALSQYQQVLHQRNALLKILSEGGDRSALDVWDREVARTGAVLTCARLGLIETLTLTFGDELTRLGETWSDVTLRYDRKTVARDEAALTDELLGLLRTHRDRDIIVQTTLNGPHREDWQAVIDGRDLPTFASRGQERTAVLALLFLQVSYLQLTRGEAPVLLLDDACSELDDAHQERLLSGFPGAQVFLTALRVPTEAQAMTVFRVEAGTVTAGSN